MSLLQRWANEKRQKKVQAAKEIYGQRGNAMMMAEARRTIWNDELSLQEKKGTLANFRGIM